MNVCLFLLCVALTDGGPGTSRAPIPAPGSAGASTSARSAFAADRWVAEDKFKHFFASFAVTVIAAGSARAAGLDARESLLAGAGTGVGVGVWKEIRDSRRPGGHFSARDLVWDLAGVGAGIAVTAQGR